jgi:hypothetical protein
MQHRKTDRRVLWVAIAVMLTAACAKQQPTYWVNRLDPDRALDADHSRCGLTAYQAGLQSTGMQAIIARQVAYENCMAAAGWYRQAASPQPSPSVDTAEPPLLPVQDRVVLVGGADRAIFLGCVSCPQTDPESVFNPTGSFGSPVSSSSVFNPVGPYGSAVSQYSICNPAAASPPVLIDSARRIRGVLTLNAAVPGAVTDERVLAWLRELCSPRG